MYERQIDLLAAATLFAGSDLGRQAGGLPPINRRFEYFPMAADAVRSACETFGPGREHAFLVQRGCRYGMDVMTALYEASGFWPDTATEKGRRDSLGAFGEVWRGDRTSPARSRRDHRTEVRAAG